MHQQKIRSSWRQRTASLMVMVLMAGILFMDMPSVYAAESEPETQELVSAPEAEGQTSALETEGQVSAPETEGQAGVPEDRSYTWEGYVVDAAVTTYWEGGYNLCVTVRNTSEETIHNWGILFETQDSIRDLYNAEILGSREGMYLLRNKVYNQDIPAGGSVIFGYTAYLYIRIEDYVREGEVTADGGEEIAVYHTRTDFGDISVRLPEGTYTVEVTLPDEEPQYYHVILSDNYDFTFYRFEM